MKQNVQLGIIIINAITFMKALVSIHVVKLVKKMYVGMKSLNPSCVYESHVHRSDSECTQLISVMFETQEHDK